MLGIQVEFDGDKTMKIVVPEDTEVAKIMIFDKPVDIQINRDGSGRCGVSGEGCAVVDKAALYEVLDDEISQINIAKEAIEGQSKTSSVDTSNWCVCGPHGQMISPGYCCSCGGRDHVCCGQVP